MRRGIREVLKEKFEQESAEFRLFAFEHLEQIKKGKNKEWLMDIVFSKFLGKTDRCVRCLCFL